MEEYYDRWTKLELFYSINNRREVEVDMEKCKKRNTEHCTKSKQCDQYG